jgi:two-component system CheB/CheR fusion protein
MPTPSKRVPESGSAGPSEPAVNDRPVGALDARAIEGSFPIVGVGASAGGLEAFTALFGALTADTGMAFVVVSHLDPAHRSTLAEILGRVTRMPVAEVTDDQVIQADHVYVLAPGREMTVEGGTLRLEPRVGQHLHRPIDLISSDRWPRLGAIRRSG